MKRNTKILMAGFVIIGITNLVALAAAAYNRSGEPAAIVELTERELGLPYSFGLAKENTGLAVGINCRVESDASDSDYDIMGANCWGSPPWFTQDKLTELGYELGDPAQADDYQASLRYMPRKVYVAMEFNGAAYQRVLHYRQQALSKEQALFAGQPENKEFEARVKRAADILENEQRYNSRLFVIDAGLNQVELSHKYAEPGRYLIMQALIRPHLTPVNQNARWTGLISDLLIDEIYIPLEHRALFDSLKAGTRGPYGKQYLPRYKVRIAIGKRYEPWVLGAEKL